MAMIGEQFTDGEEVCGAVISIRSEEDILFFWNRNANVTEVKNRIRETFLRVLDLPQGTIIEYKAHNDWIILIQRNVRRFLEKKVPRIHLEKKHPAAIMIQNHWEKIKTRNMFIEKTKTQNLFILNLAFMLIFAGISNRAIPGLILDSTRKKNSGQ